MANEVLKKLFQLDKGVKSLRMMPIYDIHYGNANFDKKSFERFFKTLKEEKDIITWGGGDWAEGATKYSLGYEDQIIDLDGQIDWLVDKFSPIVEEKRLLGIIQGNHEKRSKKTGSVDLAYRIAKELGIPYWKHGKFFNFTIKQYGNKRGHRYTGYTVHGRSGARTLGGKINAVERMAQVAAVDLYVMGHVHILHSHKGFKYVPKGSKLSSFTPTFVIGGHYLEYMGSYAQEMLLPPSGPAGSVKIKLHGDMRRISVSI